MAATALVKQLNSLEELCNWSFTPCFAVESLNNGLGNLYIPISFTVLGGNSKRISKCVLLYRVFSVLYLKSSLSEAVLYKWKNHFSEMKGDVGMSRHEKEGK